jgi:hypothetical protein
MAATAAAVALLSACADTRPLQVASPETVMQTTGVGSISAVVTRQDVQFDDKFYFPYEGRHSATKADFPKGFLPAYGSGLALKGRRADGTLEFYAITDRGPNATTGPVTQITDGSNPTGFASSTVFPSPNFTPSIGVITLGKDGARLVSTLPLKFSAAQNANGRVQPRASQATRASKFWTTPSPIPARPRATVNSAWTPNPWWWMPHAMCCGFPTNTAPSS